MSSLKQKLSQPGSTATAGGDDDLRDYGIGDNSGPFPEQSDKPARPPVERFSFRELREQYPRLHPPVIEGVLREGETGNIISVSKIGKSWLAYNILLSVATGRPIFDRFKTTAGPVLLIDNELHKPTLASRIPSVAEAMGIPASQYEDLIDVWPLRGNLRTVYELSGEFESLDPATYRLVVLDAKYRMIGDDASENDNAGETRFYNAVDRLAATIRSALLMVHHSSKGQQGDKRVTDVGAGAGAQSRAADAHLILREHEEAGAVVFDAAVRSFAPIEPLALRWDFPLWIPAGDLDPERLKGRLPPGQEQQRERDREADNLILAKCNAWQSRKQLQNSTGMGISRVQRSITRLLSAKLLNEDSQNHNGNETQVYRKSINAA